METATETGNTMIDRMFAAGAHFGLPKARRHPSALPHLFGLKQKLDVFDLEKTADALEKAKTFARKLGEERKTLLFVGGKEESQRYVKSAALRLNAPYCIGRWIGGTITNFAEIKKRIGRLETLLKDRESGALSKYTKLERLLIDREIDKLETMYAGLVVLKEKLPDALFVIDPRHEAIAIKEALTKNIPVIALASSDCNLGTVNYAIPANDSAPKSIAFFVEEIALAYEEGQRSAPLAQTQGVVGAPQGN
jgi:small subunit ribosomal protein S2